MGNSLASFTSETFSPDQLIAGDTDLLQSAKVLLAEGESRTRGAVLGRVAGAIVAAAAAGNTGNGAFGAVTAGAGIREGAYKVVCIEPAANGGKFAVYAPDGTFVGTATVAVAFAGPINFTIADGATDFIAGDFFTVTVAAGTTYKLAVAAATDGSDKAVAILTDDCDATDADTQCLVYTAGRFNSNALTLGAGHTAATVAADLRAQGITLVAALAA